MAINRPYRLRRKKKAAKVAHRTASEGLVGASVLSRGTGSGGGIRVALVELNRNTDFVTCNALFGRLVADVVCEIIVQRP